MNTTKKKTASRNKRNNFRRRTISIDIDGWLRIVLAFLYGWILMGSEPSFMVMMMMAMVCLTDCSTCYLNTRDVVSILKIKHAVIVVVSVVCLILAHCLIICV